MKFFLIKGGALLPFFFLWICLNAEDSLDKYFNVFYSDAGEYQNWVESEKKDYFKDIFIEMYHLPKSDRRIIDNTVEIKVLNSFSKEENYGYIYLDVPAKINTDMVIYGIRKGEIFINGISKGSVLLNSDSGYAHLSASFGKGVFFILLKIKEKINDVPITILSSVPLKSSKGTGFSKDSTSMLKIKNIDRNMDGHFSELYKGFCFPFNKKNESGRDLFFSLSLKDKNKESEKRFLLYNIYAFANNKTSNEVLKKIGFSIEQIEWWKKMILSSEVCRYE